MSTLSPAQIAAVVKAAGPASSSQYAAAVAVALAESGGRTDARNVNRDGSVDRGLFQFNSRWHPEVSDAAADNPASAAAAAYRVSKGFSDWHQWATWPAAATAQMGRATAAVAGSSSGGGVSLPGAVAGQVLGGLPGAAAGALTPGAIGQMGLSSGMGLLTGVDAIGGFFGALGQRSTWIRVMQVTGGAGLIIIGAVLLGKNVIADVATTVLPAGKAVKAVSAAGAVES